MGSAASVAALIQKPDIIPDEKNKKDSIVVEIVRANHLSECFGPQRKQTNVGCHSYVKFWLTSGEDLDTVKGIKAKTLARVNAFDPVFRSYRCLYSSADPNDVLHFEVWDNTVSSRPLAQVRVTMAETTSGFVLIKKLNLLHPNAVKSNDEVDDAVKTYRVDNANQVSKIYRTSPAEDATISFRVLFPHKTKGWRRRRTLFVIRHGESKWNAALANKNLGALMHFDHPLSMRGITQAKKMEDTWTADLKNQNISLTLPATIRKLKSINECDFDPIVDEKTDDQLPGRRRMNSLEDTDSCDETEDSDDDKPVREQMNNTVGGGNGRSIDASNPNAVLEGPECQAANAPGDIKSKNTNKGNTNKGTNANKLLRGPSSVSATTQPSTAPVPANSSTDYGSKGEKGNNTITLHTDDKSVSEHGKGIPLTPMSFRKHIETKISARDTPPNEKNMFTHKARVVIRKGLADPQTAENTTNVTNPTDIQDNTETDDKAALQQRVASSIGLSISPDTGAFQFPSMELINGDHQTDTREIAVLRSSSLNTSMVLTPRTGHSHGACADGKSSPLARQNFDFVVTEDIETERTSLSQPKAEIPKAEPPTDPFKDSWLRFYGASAVFSSPLTRATQTALLSLASHPVLCNSGMTLLASLREKKTQGGFDSVGKEVDKGIYMRTENELAATLLAAKDRTNGAKADAVYININSNAHSHSNMDLLDSDPAEQARRAMRKMDPYDCTTQWWISVQHKDSKQALLNRISDFLCTMEFYPTDGAIVVVGHSLFIRTFLRTYMAESFAQARPKLAEEMSQKKLQNAGCIRVDLDFQTSSHGGTMAIVNAELMFGSVFGEIKTTPPTVLKAPYKMAGSAKGPPSASLADASSTPRTRRLSSPPVKFLNRELQSKNIDDFKLPGPMIALQTSPELGSTV